MSTEDFKRVVESLRTAVAIADAKGVVAFANPAFVQLAGDPDHGVSGHALASVFHRDDGKRIQQNVARIAEGKTASALIDVRVAAGGNWVQLALQPAMDSREKPAGIVAVLHDIGGQRETESALNLTTARLMALVEASPNAALIENASGEVELVNEAFCRLLGLESAPQSLLGLPAVEVIGRSRGRRRQGALARPQEAGRPREHRPAAGRRPRPPRWSASPSSSTTSPRARCGRRTPPQALPLAEADRGASEIALIEKIGAELSVALEGISAISIRAQQMDFDPSLVEHFHRIRASTETALVAIGDLVDFSKVEGGIELRRAEFRLRAAVADLIKRIGHPAEECGCRLHVKVEQDVPDLLEGDLERLQLLLRNLLESTFAVFPGSDITLSISPEYTTESGHPALVRRHGRRRRDREARRALLGRGGNGRGGSALHGDRHGRQARGGRARPTRRSTRSRSSSPPARRRPRRAAPPSSRSSRCRCWW